MIQSPFKEYKGFPTNLFSMTSRNATASSVPWFSAKAMAKYIFASVLLLVTVVCTNHLCDASCYYAGVYYSCNSEACINGAQFYCHPDAAGTECNWWPDWSQPCNSSSNVQCRSLMTSFQTTLKKTGDWDKAVNMVCQDFPSSQDVSVGFTSRSCISGTACKGLDCVENINGVAYCCRPESTQCGFNVKNGSVACMCG